MIIKNEGFAELRKKIFYGHFSKCIFAEGRFPATSDFGDPKNPEIIEV